MLGLGYCFSFFLFIHSGIPSCHAIGAIQLKDKKDSWKHSKTKLGCSLTRTVCPVLYDLGNSSSSEKLFSIQILSKCVLIGYKWEKWNADDPFLAALWGGLRSMYIFGQLSPGFCQQKCCSYLLTSASITPVSSDYHTSKNTKRRKPSLTSTVFKVLILSKTFESQSSPVPGVSSCLQMEMQTQPCLPIAKLHAHCFPFAGTGSSEVPMQ